MNVQVEELSPTEKKLSIEVEPARVADELTRAYGALGRQVKVPGFRPGKVPRRILEQRFREQVEDDVIQRLVNQAFFEAVSKEKVDAVGQPQVTPAGGLKAGEPFRFEARVEVRPRVEPRDYQGLALTRREVKVEDAAVDQQLERIRQGQGRMEDVQGRDVAQAGDFCTVDYEAAVEGQPFPGSRAQDVTVEVAPGELVESNIEQLAGVKVGDTKTVDYTFKDDYRVEDLRGKTAQFRITLKGLKARVLPALDDQLAQSTGQAQTLAALREKLKTDLERSEKARLQADEREEILNALLDKNAFEVPNAMVERALDAMLDGALRNMMRSGIDPRQLNVDFSSIRNEMRERAVREVKGALLLEAVAEKEKVEVTDQDLDARFEELARDNGMDKDAVKRFFQNPEERRGLSLRLREEKAIEFLKGQAKYS